MSEIICCRPPRPTDEDPDPSYWRCSTCGQWWRVWCALNPEKVSKLDMILFHFSEWRHWHAACNIIPSWIR